jgi:hypothetical protein
MIVNEIVCKDGFRIITHLDEKNSSKVSSGDINEILSKNDPITFSGQRTLIYNIDEKRFLRAKGFGYREDNYSEIKKHELNNHNFLTLDYCNKNFLKMKNYSRPIPKKFKGQSVHFFEHNPMPNGSFVKKFTSPRPYGAMTLDRAINEYESTYWAREKGIPVDIPLGFAEFPDLGFSHNKKKIPCGGFLAMCPTVNDLRSTQILYHTKHLDSLRKFYELPKVDNSKLIHEFCRQMGFIVSAFHEDRKTLRYVHSMNFKLGTFDENEEPIFSNDFARPIVSIADLDAVYKHENDVVFCAEAIRDFQGLTTFPGRLFFNHIKIAKGLDDNQKGMHDLVTRICKDYDFDNPGFPLFSALDGYFGFFDERMQGVDFFAYDNLRRENLFYKSKKNVLLNLIKEKHKLSF